MHNEYCEMANDETFDWEVREGLFTLHELHELMQSHAYHCERIAPKVLCFTARDVTFCAEMILDPQNDNRYEIQIRAASVRIETPGVFSAPAGGFVDELGSEVVRWAAKFVESER